MFDPRVIRGSMYSVHRNAVLDRGPALPPPPGAPPPKRFAKKKSRWRERSIFDFQPPEKLGAEMNLTSFLVEKEEGVSAAEVDTQTNDFEPMPEEKPYEPQKSGLDAATQMTNDDQPFQFDREVGPLLEVLVQKTIEQALLEVEQETELAAIAADLDKLRAQQASEATRAEAIEVETISVFRARGARRKAERERAAREANLRAKVAGVRLMKQNWPVILDDVRSGLEARGDWCRPAVWAIRAQVLPWLYQNVADNVATREVAGRLVDTLLGDAIDSHAVDVVAERDAREAPALENEEGAKRKDGWIRIFLDGKTLGLHEDQVVGPIQVLEKDTVSDIEVKIADWLRGQGLEVSLPSEGLLHLSMGGKQLSPGARLLDGGVVEGSKLEVVLPENAEEEGRPT
jgi:hypothetical protein